MRPDKIQGLPAGSGGSQETAIALSRGNISLQQNRAAAQEPVDRAQTLAQQDRRLFPR